MRFINSERAFKIYLRYTGYLARIKKKIIVLDLDLTTVYHLILWKYLCFLLPNSIHRDRMPDMKMVLKFFNLTCIKRAKCQWPQFSFIVFKVRLIFIRGACHKNGKTLAILSTLHGRIAFSFEDHLKFIAPIFTIITTNCQNCI